MDKIKQFLLRIRKANRSELLRIQAEIDDELEAMLKEEKKKSDSKIRKQYLAGVAVVAYALGKKKAYLTVLDKQAVTAIQKETAEYLSEAYAGIKRSTTRIMAEAQKERIRQIISEGRLTGESVTQVRGKVVELLEKDLTALIDKSGRRWKADTYADMLLKKAEKEANINGTLNRMREEDKDLVKIIRERSVEEPRESHIDYEGKIYSVTGKSEKYPALDDVMYNEPYLLTAIGCGHGIIPVGI